MANEISWRYSATGSTLYFTIRNASRQMWNGTGVETLTVANWGNYDIALTETPASSYFYVGDWPAALTTVGFYYVDLYVQAGGSAAISDTQGPTLYGYWNGTKFEPAGADVDQITGTAAGTFGSPSGLPKLDASGYMPETPYTAADIYDYTQAIYNASLGQVLQVTTIATLASQTSFTLTAGSADNDAYNGCPIVFRDASTTAQKSVCSVADYVGSSKTVTLNESPAFTIAVGDNVYILPAARGLEALIVPAIRTISATEDTVVVKNAAGTTLATFTKTSPAGVETWTRS